MDNFVTDIIRTHKHPATIRNDEYLKSKLQGLIEKLLLLRAKKEEER